MCKERLKFSDLCAKGLITGGNERELKRKEKTIQDGIEVAHMAREEAREAKGTKEIQGGKAIGRNEKRGKGE